MPIAAPPRARAWRVLSHTEALTGEERAVSSVVIAPDGPAPKRGRVIVSWAHGTTGLAETALAAALDPGIPRRGAAAADTLALLETARRALHKRPTPESPPRSTR